MSSSDIPPSATTPPHSTESHEPGAPDTPVTPPPATWRTRLSDQCRRSIQSLWLPWVLVVLLILIILVLALPRWTSTHHRDQIYVDRYHSPYVHVIKDHPYRSIDDLWYDHMRTLDRQHREMMSLVDGFDDQLTVSHPGQMSGQYTGTRLVDGTRLDYALTVDDKVLTGTISGTLTGTITSIKKELQNLGISPVENLGKIQFSTHANLAPKVLDLLDR